MSVYLPNIGTRRILFQPISAHIVAAHTQLAEALESVYTAEEKAAVSLPTAEALTERVERYAAADPVEG